MPGFESITTQSMQSPSSGDGRRPCAACETNIDPTLRACPACGNNPRLEMYAALVGSVILAVVATVILPTVGALLVPVVFIAALGLVVLDHSPTTTESLI